MFLSNARLDQNKFHLRLEIFLGYNYFPRKLLEREREYNTIVAQEEEEYLHGMQVTRLE